MPGRSRRSSSTLSPQCALAGSQAQVGTDNSLMRAMVQATPAGPMLGAWEGLGALGDLLTADEDVAAAHQGASWLASAAGFANKAFNAGMPGAGVIGSAYGLTNTARAVDDIQDNGWNLENGFSLANGIVGTVGPWLGPTGSALAAAWGAGTKAGSALDQGSEIAARHMAGEDGDARGLSDRLADRGSAVDAFFDSELTGLLGQENADLAGDVLGGVFTVGQLATPALHYDLVDSFTGGGLTDAKDAAGEAISNAWDWATDW